MKLRKRMMRRALGSLLLAVLLLALMAYPASRLGVFEWPRAYDPLAVPDMRAEPNFLTPWQMKLVDAAPRQCLAAFALAGIAAKLEPVRAEGTACELSGAITLDRLSAARLAPQDTRCAIAARRLLDEPVAEILQLGSYACRTKRGASSMSEHATANAFDISGFRMASGKVILVKEDWGKASPEGKFLHVAHDGLCDWFNLTLGPDYNADHADHFHVDMGWWRNCR